MSVEEFDTNDPLARMFGALLGTILYVERLAHANLSDFVVIAGERAAVVKLLGFDPGSDGTHGVGAMPRVDVLARLVRAGVPLAYLPQIAHPVGADEFALVLVSSEHMNTLRCPREELLRAPPSKPIEGTVTIAFKRPPATPQSTPEAPRRALN